MAMIQDLRTAWPLHKDAALMAHELFKSYCAAPLPRVPGMDTPSRLALRFFYKGCTVEECAAREYLYRWQLAIKAPDQCVFENSRLLDSCVSIFGTPHPIGM